MLMVGGICVAGADPALTLCWQHGARGARHCWLVVRPGDAIPADACRGQWYSGWHATVEWLRPRTWSWLIYQPLFRGVGACLAEGVHFRGNLACRAAAAALLRRIPDLTPAERGALERLAGMHPRRSA